MKNKIVSLVVLVFCIQEIVVGDDFKHSWRNKIISKIVRNRPMFHIARYYTNLRTGSGFTCDQIAGDGVRAKSGCFVDCDASSGSILRINDGKKTPLVLGSIPTKQEHIHQLKCICDNNVNNKKLIGVFTLNEKWECDAAGLSKLIQGNKELLQYNYSTRDMTAPTFIDLLRAVNDLECRDERDMLIALVHCKAGRGRSATVVAAYLIHVIHKAGLKTTPEDVEAYLVKHRRQVRLSRDQKHVLSHFYEALKNAGTFEKLCEQHTFAIQKRDQEMANSSIK